MSYTAIFPRFPAPVNSDRPWLDFLRLASFIGINEGLHDGVDHQLATERAILCKDPVQLIFHLTSYRHTTRDLVIFAEFNLFQPISVAVEELEALSISTPGIMIPPARILSTTWEHDPSKPW